MPQSCPPVPQRDFSHSLGSMGMGVGAGNEPSPVLTRTWSASRLHGSSALDGQTVAAGAGGSAGVVASVGVAGAGGLQSRRGKKYQYGSSNLNVAVGSAVDARELRDGRDGRDGRDSEHSIGAYPSQHPGDLRKSKDIGATWPVSPHTLRHQMQNLQLFARNLNFSHFPAQKGSGDALDEDLFHDRASDRDREREMLLERDRRDRGRDQVELGSGREREGGLGSALGLSATGGVVMGLNTGASRESVGAGGVGGMFTVGREGISGGAGAGDADAVGVVDLDEVSVSETSSDLDYAYDSSATLLRSERRGGGWWGGQGTDGDTDNEVGARHNRILDTALSGFGGGGGGGVVGLGAGAEGGGAWGHRNSPHSGRDRDRDSPREWAHRHRRGHGRGKEQEQAQGQWGQWGQWAIRDGEGDRGGNSPWQALWMSTVSMGDLREDMGELEAQLVQLYSSLQSTHLRRLIKGKGSPSSARNA
ncbi:hypothetical protein B484DRAFT_455621 [Ochromonadaceae sp. CCMP2298]|nr:hypothetical protein B484DRAFT_455621 [Ochromonadaceae sp. CCMP2298]